MFHGSILLFGIICRLEEEKTLDMSLPFVQFRIVEGREVLLPRQGLRDTYIGA